MSTFWTRAQAAAGGTLRKVLYTPLSSEKSQIRLLKFGSIPSKRSSPENDPICLKMKTISLNDTTHPQFNTLSYVWGKPIFQKRISINGIEVAVTDNLYLALRHLNESRNDSYWWVDALCIDQSNLDERGTQVQMMSRIYASAANTVAHLGTFRPNTALDFIRTLASYRTEPNAVDWIAEAAAATHYADQWRALHALLELPYWTRVWILQEFIISPQLQIFDPDGPWLDISSLYEAVIFLTIARDVILSPLYDGPKLLFQTNLDRITERIRLRLRYWPGLRGTSSPLGVMETYLIAQQLEAADPRDLLYAFVSITENGQDVIGRPNYALSARETFACFVKSYFEKYRSLDTILTGRGTKRMDGFPTWVPTFSEPLGRANGDSIIKNNLGRVRPHTKSQLELPFHASGTAEADATFSADLRVLSTTGVSLGKVTALSGWFKDSLLAGSCEKTTCMEDNNSGPLPSRSDVFESLAHASVNSSLAVIEGPIPPGLLGQILETSILLATLNPPSELMFLWVAEWWNMVKDMRICNRPLSSWLDEVGSLEARLQGLLRATPDCGQLEYRSAELADYTMVREIFLGRMGSVFEERERRLLATQRGEIGLAPNICMLGDEVWVLHGCSIPVVLRRNTQGGFELVGECYFHGYMHGEAVSEGRVTERCAIY